MGDVTMTAGATAEEVMAVLEPVIVRAGPVGVGIIVTIVIVAAVAEWGSQKNSTRCKKEWRDAEKICKELLRSPNPPRGVTGNALDEQECMEGLVRHVCGGKRIDRDMTGASGRRF